MTVQNPRLGVMLMALTTVVFAAQDGISRHLAGTYNVFMVVMIRYWFFAAFVLIMAARSKGGLGHAFRPHHPILQAFRGVLLVAEIFITIASFVILGLVDAQSIFISYPLIIAALSVPFLGEKIGWRRWCAIAVGFVGVLIILKPGFGVFAPAALMPLAGAFMFAVYGVLTRYVARRDEAGVSFFWTGIAGMVAATPFGLWHWQEMTGGDWVWMTVLSLLGILGHGLMIRAYALAEASTLQPIAYLQLVFSAGVGMTVFGDALHINVAVGALLTTGAGLFTIWRARQQARREAALAQG